MNNANKHPNTPPMQKPNIDTNVFENSFFTIPI